MPANTSLISRPALTTALVALILLVPGLAQAGSNPLYYQGVDRSWGETREDDGAVAHAPNTFLDGATNRIVFPATLKGDGGRFLDARIAQGNAQLNVFAAHLAAPVTTRSDLIFPGPVYGVAWYGEWSDLNTNGVIDDVHDILADAADEFTWRGRSSDADVSMFAFVYPTPKSFPTNAFRLRGFSEGAYQKVAYKDETDATEQVWSSNPATTWAVTPGIYDASLLTPLTMVTVADARPVSGAPGGLLLSDPAALVDVDVYGTLNGDAELLYASMTSVLKPSVNSALDAYFQAFSDAGNIIANPPTDVPDTSRTVALVQPAFPREPNHVGDDYGGHAFFGGVGDVLGSYNSYPGYQSEAHHFVDAVGEIMWFPTVDVDTGTGIHENVQRSTVDISNSFSPPYSDDYPHGRKVTTVFGISAVIIAWFDENGDGFVGHVCDPADPDAWDAERATCRDPRTTGGRFASSSSDRGGLGLCAVSAKGTVTVTPVGGNWPGVILVRDHEHYSSVVWNRDWEVLTDDRSVQLDWRPCLSSSVTRSRDLLVFPAGSPTIPMLTSFASTSGEWVDANGILHASETVTDVDVYYPVL